MLTPYSAKPGDEKLTRGTVIVDGITATALASGRETMLAIKGALPSPCHELRLALPPIGGGAAAFPIEAWSVFDPHRVCAQVLQPFSAEIAVPAGRSDITVNGQGVNR
jgi:hypothetical protein